MSKELKKMYRLFRLVNSPLNKQGNPRRIAFKHILMLSSCELNKLLFAFYRIISLIEIKIDTISILERKAWHLVEPG